jgi:ribosomal protein S18 acetylase RimI-like enzyme
MKWEVYALKAVSYKELNEAEIDRALFTSFNRYQEVTKCWRNENGEWKLKDIPFIEQWGPDEYEYLIKNLHNTIRTGGTVIGAFYNNVLIGFTSVESELFGLQKQYIELSSIHTSCESRGIGVGRNLFSLACRKAKEMGAEKLYISAHSSQESQAFYKMMGCVEAEEYNSRLVAKEPCDCQLEYNLQSI